MSTSKRLHELQINEIRKELKRRDIVASGNKEALVSRLREALKEDGFDPDTHEFEVKTDLGGILSEMKKELLGSMQTIATSQKTDMEEFRSKLRDEIAAVKSELTVQMEQKIQVLSDEVQAVRVELGKVKGTKVNLGSSEATGKVKPPIFDGTVSWTVYKRQFEAAAKVNNWRTNEEKATGLMLALRGKATELLQIVSDQQDYEALVRTMELRFGDEHMKEVYRVQLKTRQQKPGETLQELMADIERLARLAYPTLTQEILDVLVTDAFIDGVHDPELKKAIRLSGKREASDALIYALSFEAAKGTAKTTYFSRGLHVQEEDLTHIIRQVVDTIEDRRSQQMPRQNRSVFRCWNCDAPGHIQRNCTRRNAGRLRGRDGLGNQQAATAQSQNQEN